MNTSQNNTPSELDEVEDLTLFADESFDTDDVDLFEFTGEDDAPLTLLKSIILSLDWEINDDILQELTDEIGNLQLMWQGDKVAKVYLQGLDKIGSYLRMEGAYAHPNAIKLLLTFFYDFEKILSSHEITGDSITALLKADVRKFKILQYQINQTKGTPTIVSPTPSVDLAGQEEEIALEEGSGKEAPVIECEPLTCLKATILGLEWEVTDKGLDQFNSHISDVREHFMENKSANILIQGLQALGGYITDERVHAHPESFNLLHSFYEGLELLLEDEKLSDKERQDILVDRVNRLNNLKSIIAASTAVPPSQGVADDIIDEVMAPVEAVDDESLEEELQFDESPAPDDSENELTLDFAEEDMTGDESPIAGPAPRAAMETADTAYPDDILDPGAIQAVDIEGADDFIEEELSIGTEIAPALLGADETTPEEEAPDSEIAEGLDLFFGNDKEDSFEKLNISVDEDDEGVEELELSFSDEEDDTVSSSEATALSDAIIAGDEEPAGEAEQQDQLFIDDEELTFALALGDAGEEGGFDEKETVATLTEEPSGELDDKLDAFFGSDEETVTEETEEAIELEKDLVFAPALGDADEEGGFDEEDAVATMAEEPSGELDDKLDAFFGSDEETEEAIELEEDLVFTPALGDADEEGDFDEENAEEFVATEDELSVASALGDAEEKGGFNEDDTVATLADESKGELDDKLDSFFGSDEEAETEAEGDLTVAPALDDTAEGVDKEKTVVTLTEEATTESDANLDSFFVDDEETVEVQEETVPKENAALLALAGGLAALATGPSAQQIEENQQLVRQIQEEPEQTTEQTVLLQLVNSVLTLIPGDSTELPTGTAELTEYLFEQLASQESSSDTLITAIGRFTDWQKNRMQEVLTSSVLDADSTATMPAVDNITQVTSEVRSGFDDLRSALKEEFTSLRDELKQNKS